MATKVKAADCARHDAPGRAAAEVTGGATTMWMVEIAPGPSDRGPHVHDDFEEIIHVLAGEGLFRTDGAVIPVGPGDTIVVPAGERHATENVGGGPLRLVCAFPVPDIGPGTRTYEGWD